MKQPERTAMMPMPEQPTGPVVESITTPGGAPGGRRSDGELAVAVLFELEQRLGRRSIERYFQHSVRLTVADDELSVGVASPFLLAWVQKQFRPSLLEAAATVLGPSARLRFEVDGRLATALAAAPLDDGIRTAPGGTTTDSAQRTSDAPHAAPRTPSSSAAGQRRFASLSDFVEGGCNRLALTSARQICEAPGTRYNPLYVHGGVGLGKTHLLEGIYGEVRRQFPALRVMFLSAEGFANYFTAALREKTLPAFRQRFRTLDVLLVDDVDFFDGKRGIAEEFLHTFKELESRGRQLVLSGDRHPRLLLKSSEELTSRLQAGLVCRLEPPDAETRQRIVRVRSTRIGAALAPEALDYVAGRFTANIRELEGALNCLATWHAMTDKRVSLSAARQALAELERDCIRIIRPADVENTVCRFFGVASDDLRSTRRHQAVSRPRMVAMYLMRKHTHAAYSEIGQYFGGRNHATVIAAEKKVRGWLDTRCSIPAAGSNWPADDLIDALEQQLGS